MGCASSKAVNDERYRNGPVATATTTKVTVGPNGMVQEERNGQKVHASGVSALANAMEMQQQVLAEEQQILGTMPTFARKVHASMMSGLMANAMEMQRQVLAKQQEMMQTNPEYRKNLERQTELQQQLLSATSRGDTEARMDAQRQLTELQMSPEFQQGMLMLQSTQTKHSTNGHRATYNTSPSGFSSLISDIVFAGAGGGFNGFSNTGGVSGGGGFSSGTTGGNFDSGGGGFSSDMGGGGFSSGDTGNNAW